MNKSLRNLSVLIVGVLAVVVFFRTYAGVADAQSNTPATPAAASSTDSAIIDRGDMLITVGATGQLVPAQQVNLAFVTSDVVTVIAVQPGDRVLKGQLLAAINQQTLQDDVLLAQAQLDVKKVAFSTLTGKPRQVDIDVAQASLNVAQAGVNAAAHSGSSPLTVQKSALSVDTAKTQLWQAELSRDANAKQQADAIKAGRNDVRSTTQQDNASIDQAQSNVDIAQSNLDGAQSAGSGNPSGIASAQVSLINAQNALNTLINGANAEDVKQAQADVDSAQSSLSEAITNLDKTKLIAPFDGVVGQVNLNLGQPAPTSAAIVLLNTSSFYVDLPVDESDIPKVAVGQETTLKFDALRNVTLTGKVTRVAAVSTTVGTSITYTVRVEFAPSGQPLLPTMSTTATIITGQAKDIVRIPTRFVTASGGKYYTNLLQSNGRFKQSEIKLGLRSTTYSQVTSGLAEGDTVSSVTIATTGGGPGGGGSGGPPPGGN